MCEAYTSRSQAVIRIADCTASQADYLVGLISDCCSNCFRDIGL